MAGRLKTDPLFLGLTRPAMILGVSFMYLMSNCFACILYFVLTSDFKIFIVGVVVHAIGMFLTKKEPLMVDIMFLKLRKFNGGANKSFYKGLNSYNLFS